MFGSFFGYLRRLLLAGQSPQATGARRQFPNQWEDRTGRYTEWELLYDNEIYKTLAMGGMRETIQQMVFGSGTSEKLYGFYNPAQEIVNAYQGVFVGRWGQEIRPSTKFMGKDVSAALLDHLTQTWLWSNMATARQTMCETAAKLGTCGLRIVADPEAGSPVWISVDHPSHIVDFDEDARGNVTDILLEYQVQERGTLGTEQRAESVYQERLGKEMMQRLQDGKVVGEWPNPTGVCPYVLLRHKGSEAFGYPAFWGSEDQIHLINRIISRQDVAADEMTYGVWFLTGGGRAPEQIDLRNRKAWYTQTSAGEPPPTANHLHAQLDLQRVSDLWSSLVEKLKERQPELLLNDLKVRSGQSGDSIAQLMKPAEHVLRLAKDRYEHAFIRATQIAASFRIVRGDLDVGTGTKTQAAADAAYQGGLLNYEFMDRAVLPENIYDQTKRADSETERRKRNLEDADTAKQAGLPMRECYMIYADGDQEKVGKMMEQMRTEDVVLDARMQEPPVVPGAGA